METMIQVFDIIGALVLGGALIEFGFAIAAKVTGN